MAAGFLGGLLGGGGDDYYDLYGDLLTDKQRAALRSREMTQGLLRMSGAFAEAAKPSLLPTGGIGSALGKGAAALAGGEDEALKGLATAEKIREARSTRALQEKLSPLLLRQLERKNGLPPGSLGPATTGPLTTGPGSASPPPQIDPDNAGFTGVPGSVPGGGDFPGVGAMPPPLPSAGLTPRAQLPPNMTSGRPGAGMPPVNGMPIDPYDPNFGFIPPSPPQQQTGLLPPPDQVIPPPQFGGPLAMYASYGGSGMPGDGAPNNSALAAMAQTIGAVPGREDLYRTAALGGGPPPPFRRAAASSGAAGAAGPAGDDVLDRVIAPLESGNRNIHQQVVSPSVSSASGYYQITNSTWRDTAPKAGVDTGKYPTAMSAPRDVQKQVAQELYRQRGAQPWADFNPAVARALNYAGASQRGERPGDIVLPSGDGGAPQLEALQALMQLTRPSGGDDENTGTGGGDALTALRTAVGGAAPSLRPASANWPFPVLKTAPSLPPPQGYQPDSGPGYPTEPTNRDVSAIPPPEVPMSPEVAATLSGGSGRDTVIPSSRGGRLPITRAQYNPLAGAANQPAGAAGTAAAPGVPGAEPIIPGTDWTPRELAAMNALTEMAKLGTPFKGLLETYYKSPEYLAGAAGAETRARLGVETELKPGLEAAVEKAKSPILLERKQGEAEIERRSEEIKQNRDLYNKLQQDFAKDNLTMVEGSDGKIKLVPLPDAQRIRTENERLKTEATEGEKLVDVIVNGREMKMPTKTYREIFSGKGAPELGIPPMSSVQLGKPTDLGPTPEGYRRVTAPDGSVRYEVVTGGPAAQKTAEAERKAQEAQYQLLLNRDIVVGTVDRIEGMIDSAILPTTGAVGSWLSNLGGTAAKNIRAANETLKARMSIDEINRIRNSNATGAAFGSLTEKEGERVAAAQSALDQSQDEAEYRYNLRLAKQIYLDATHRARLPDTPVLRVPEAPGAKAPTSAPGAPRERRWNPQTGRLE
jgi:hypothetical protein